MLSSRVVHAYLFTGPAGTGKRSLANICAQTLCCQSTAEKPCGICPSCQRFESGNHPDFIKVVPEKSIGVEAVRDLIARLAIKPYEGGRHVVVIEQAEKMTTQAQNALLKTLETPPGADVFFLVSSQMSSILPTIISRCRIVRFHNLEEQEAIEALRRHGLAEDRVRLLARLSQGAVGQALEMNASEDWWALRNKVLKALDALHDKQDVGFVAAMLSDNKDKASEILDILELCARDVMIIQDSDGSIIQTDMDDSLSRLRFTGSILLSDIIEARKMLASNVVWQSVLEMLFFKMAGGKL